MNPGKFYVLRNGVGDDFPVGSYGVHFNLLGLLYEFAHHHRVLFGDGSRHIQEIFELFIVGHHIHGGTRQHIGWSDEYGITHLVDKAADITCGGELGPPGLVDTQPVKQRGEFIAVFSAVDILRGSSQDRHLPAPQLHGQVIGDLTAHRQNHPQGLFQLGNVQYPLKTEFIKVKPVTGIIIGTYRFRIIIDHH